MKNSNPFTSSARNISIGDLRDMMQDHLSKRGHSVEFVAGYLEAQTRSGWLRENAPAWIRNSAALYYLLPTDTDSPAPELLP